MNSRHPVIYTLHQRYSDKPDLIEAALTQMGAERIKTVGRSVHCTCPIHKGQDPNFRVWFHNGLVTWKCYSRACGRGPFHTLPMHRFEFTEQEAVIWLAGLSGLHVDGQHVHIPRQALDDAETRAFERRYAIEKAADYEIMDEKLVAYAMRQSNDYFKNRGYTDEVLRRYQVGFVPGRVWVRPRKDGELNADGTPKLEGWFEDRVAIPVRLKDGTLIGFSGRRLDDEKFQKYKILPGTKKGFTLYGMHLPETQRMIQKSRKLVIVEGFADVWRAWMHGIYNVVCFMGTDPTPQQIELIAGFVLKDIIIYFDGDVAGQTAAHKYASSVKDLATLRNAVPPKNAKGEDQDPGDLVDRDSFLLPLVQSKVFPIRRVA